MDYQSQQDFPRFDQPQVPFNAPTPDMAKPPENLNNQPNPWHSPNLGQNPDQFESRGRQGRPQQNSSWQDQPGYPNRQGRQQRDFSWNNQPSNKQNNYSNGQRKPNQNSGNQQITCYRCQSHIWL